MLVRRRSEPLPFLRDHIIRAFEDYRDGDLLGLQKKRRKGREMACLDLLAYSILKGIGELHERDEPLGVEMVLQIVDPLISDPLLHRYDASTEVYDSTEARDCAKYRSLVYSHALRLINRALEFSTIEECLVPNPNGPYVYSPQHGFVGRPRAGLIPRITKYMKLLLEHQKPYHFLGISGTVPRLCRLPDSELSGMEAEMEEFRTTWAALRDCFDSAIAAMDRPGPHEQPQG